MPIQQQQPAAASSVGKTRASPSRSFRLQDQQGALSACRHRPTLLMYTNVQNTAIKFTRQRKVCEVYSVCTDGDSFAGAYGGGVKGWPEL